LTSTSATISGRLAAALGDYPRQMLAAGVRAQNRTMTTLRKEAATLLQPQLAGIKVGTLKRQLRLERATGASPRGLLEFSANRFRAFGNLPLRQIRTRYGTGVALSRQPYRLELADGTPLSAEIVRRLFLQRSRSGKVNVWARDGSLRFPIHAVVTPSVAHAFRERLIGARLVALGRTRFSTVLRQEMTFRLAKRKIGWIP
jgi:hypothetical protein